MVKRNSVLVTTNINDIDKTMEKFETIQIGEIVEIISPSPFSPPNAYIKILYYNNN
jgi:hypothetical protein